MYRTAVYVGFYISTLFPYPQRVTVFVQRSDVRPVASDDLIILYYIRRGPARILIVVRPKAHAGGMFVVVVVVVVVTVPTGGDGTRRRRRWRRMRRGGVGLGADGSAGNRSPRARHTPHRPAKMASRRAQSGRRGPRLSYWTGVWGGHECHGGGDKRFPPAPRLTKRRSAEQFCSRPRGISCGYFFFRIFSFSFFRSL